MDITPSSATWQSFYKFMIGSILPRPIGWISTISANGRPNLAPYSFFNAVCANPPHVLFCPMIRTRDGAQKDSLSNVRETGEFVVNIVTFALAEAMNLTSGEYDPDIDEFDRAALTPFPSLTVRPPRVAESPIHFECQLAHILDLSDEPGGGSVVVGRVTHLHVDESVMFDDDKIDVTKLDPIARMAGGNYTRIGEIFSLERPKV